MKLVIKLLLLSLALASSACTSFDRAWVMWKPENTKPEGTILGLPPRTLAQSPWDGRWTGRWTSSKHKKLNGEPESGNLRIVLSKYDPYLYRANVRANFNIFKSDYETFLYGHPHGNTLHLRSEAPAGKVLGGAYRYDGTVTPNHFTMSSESNYDNGTFELTR